MFGAPTPFKAPRNKKRRWNIQLSPDVEKARKFPIESLYKGDLKTSGKAKIGKCPFHEEDTPSFAIYPETNSWNCFADKGCGGGDVITFYMKLHNCDFRTAIKELAR